MASEEEEMMMNGTSVPATVEVRSEVRVEPTTKPTINNPTRATVTMTEEEEMEAAMNGEAGVDGESSEQHPFKKRNRWTDVRADNKNQNKKQKVKETPEGKVERKDTNRGDRRGDSGARGGSTRSRETGEGDADGDDGELKLPKKKVALLVGFNGSGYHGMQFQFGTDQKVTKTIESTLYTALTQAGAISTSNSLDPKKVDLQRAARTDTGVSAAGNVVSLKMITAVPGYETHDALVERINEFLPDSIRLWGYTRTLGGFNARTSCETRVYEYLFPSYVLLPPRKGSAMDKAFHAGMEEKGEERKEEHPFWAQYSSEAEQDAEKFLEETAAGGGQVTADDDAASKALESSEAKEARRRDLEKKRAWRVSSEELERFKSIVKLYEGSHNFHNYTLFKPFNDKTVRRFMIDISVAEPEVYGDIEWISVKIHGQSFMLHQIRKMISMAILVARTGTPPDVIPKSFENVKVVIPKAPALGLLLEQPRFGSYNSRVEKLSGQNMLVAGEPINFAPHAEKIHQFKLKQIYERLRQDEERMGSFQAWILSMDGSKTTDFSYLNPRGEIPERKEGKGNGNGGGRYVAGVDSEDEEGNMGQDDGEM